VKVDGEGDSKTRFARSRSEFVALNEQMRCDLERTLGAMRRFMSRVAEFKCYVEARRLDVIAIHAARRTGRTDRDGSLACGPPLLEEMKLREIMKRDPITGLRDDAGRRSSAVDAHPRNPPPAGRP